MIATGSRTVNSVAPKLGGLSVRASCATWSRSACGGSACAQCVAKRANTGPATITVGIATMKP